MKKVLSFMLTLCMVLMLFAVVPAQVSAATSGTCGDNLTWTLDGEGTLTISGRGAMSNWSSSNVPWYSYRSSIKSVIIGNGVTSIGNYAFTSCSSLTSVTIPNSVTSIGNSAFGGCTSLTSVTIPDSVTSIGNSAFLGCSRLTSIDIPDSVTSIGDRAFYYCSSLTSINVDVENKYYSSDERGVLFNKDKTELIQYPIGNTATSYIIPDSVTSIGNYAFEYCSSLTSIDIPEGVTSIGDRAFWSCTSLTSIDIPEGVTSIGVSAFSYCSSLTSVTIGNGVTSIGDAAFYDCSSLTSLTIGNGVTSIGSSAFSGCSRLTSIDIPEGVTSIGSSAFWSCTSLTSIDIPDSVTSIGNYAFEYCSSLTSVTIGNGVTSIGSSAFYYCESLEIVYYSGSEEQWNNITIGSNNNPLKKSTIIFNYKGGATIIASGTCGDNLTWTLDYDGTLTISGTGAMYDWSYSSDVPWYSNRSSVKKVIIGNSVTSIGNSAFRDCSSLTSIDIPDSVTSIGNYAFTSCSSLTSIDIPDRVTSIGTYAFRDCSSLTSVTIPDSVTSIGDSSFSHCSSLTSVTIGNSVTSIGNGAFSHCSSLTSVTIPDSVTSIGIGAFSGCTSLKDVYYYGSEEDWGKINVGRNNQPLLNATINYIFKGLAVTDVELNSTELTLNIDESETLVATVTPENATNKNVTWTSSDETVATVDGGVVTAVGEGVATITVTTEDDGFTATCLVTVKKPNKCGDNLFWELSDDGVLTISGSGSMYGWTYGQAPPWYSYRDSIKSVKISEGATSIGSYAFQDCSSLTSVTIPDSVTSIGYAAFEECSSLTSVTIPDSVTSIGDCAFSDCRSLTSINVDVENKYYSSDERGVLFNKDKTALIQYPIGNTATSYIIPDGVTSIGYAAFSGCSSLTSVTIPDKVTRIGEWAFYGCSSLTSVTIGNGVTSIGDYAFYYCTSLTSVTIPDSVTRIGSSAFCECSRLKDVYYYGSEEDWVIINILSYNSPLFNATIHYNFKGVAVTGVELNLTELTLNIDESETLTATISPANADNKNITWSSSDESIATVENGVVTAVGEGTATITVTTEDGGYTATCTVKVEAKEQPQPTGSPIADIATLRCYEASFNDDTKKIAINVDRFPVINKSGSMGVAIIPAEGYTVTYNFTSSNGATSGFSNTNTSKYTLLSSGVNTETSGGGALGNVPMKIFKKEDSTRIYVDVILIKGNESVTYKMTIALRDPIVLGDVDIDEIKPLRADPDSFVLDNEAKTIYYETLPGVTSAGFAVRVDNNFTKATRPRRVLTAKSGYSLAHGDIKTEEKDTFDRYVVARRSAGTTQTYQVKVHGGEDGLTYSWYTVTVVFK